MGAHACLRVLHVTRVCRTCQYSSVLNVSVFLVSLAIAGHVRQCVCGAASCTCCSVSLVSFACLQDMSVKECIVKELAAAEKPLRSTVPGAKVLQRTGADAYKRDPEQWR